MIVLPTLDLRAGACARPDVFAGDIEAHPLSVVRAWAHAGFHSLHLTDADADAGAGSNDGLIESVLRDGAAETQVGGGVQSTDQIERLVDAGAARVVLGPRAIDDPEWLGMVAELFPDLLVVGTEVRARRVVTRGWVRSLPIPLLDIVEELDGLPLAGLLLATAATDGARTASDLALLEDVVESCAFPVMAIGAVTTMDDLRALEHRGISAVVLGLALASGELDPHVVAQEYGA